MYEFRWLVVENPNSVGHILSKTLQVRWQINDSRWTDWQDVPVVYA